MKLVTTFESVPLKNIEVGERFRKVFTGISELAKTISEEGLINPVTLLATPKEKLPFMLLAGERRMKAIQSLNQDMISACICNRTLTPLEMRNIELQENYNRCDFDFAEMARLKREISETQIEIHGRKISTAPDATGTSDRDTAKLLGISPANLSRAKFLADALDAFPELAKSKNEKEAMSRLKKISEEVIRSNQAAELESKQADTPTAKLHRNLSNSYIMGDFFEKIKEVPSGSIDLVEVDPPYGIDLKNVKKYQVDDQDIQTYNEIDFTNYPIFMTKLASELYRVMARDSWLILWFGPEPWFEIVYNILLNVGEKDETFKGNRIAGMWIKGGNSQTLNPSIYLANSWEPFFYFRKGNPTIQKPGRTNIYDFKRVSSQSKTHPTERPIEMIQEILSTFGKPGSRLLVPFLGSGNTLLAASNLMIDGFGFDLTREYKDAYILKVHKNTPGHYKSYRVVEGGFNDG